MRSKITKIAEIILKYENDFNGALKHGYKNNQEFLNDLINEIQVNKVNEILDYYRRDLLSRNNTNSTPKQRNEIRDIILILEGQC